MAFSARFLNELRKRTRLSDLVSRCGIKLMRRGCEFVGLCPFHRERTPSFTVANDKQFFHCFGCGAHGDVFAFLMLLDKVDFCTAVAQIAAGLGAEMSKAPHVGAVSNTNRLTDREERNRQLAWRLWAAAGDPRGTPVEKYLHHRNLELPSIPALRWAPRCWNRETGRELPAMLARVDGADGRFTAVHRTWLLPDGSGKAALCEPKWSLGPTKGAAVRLAQAADVLIVAEGIETTLAAMISDGQPGWAAISAGGITRLSLPSVVKTVIIAADHDASGAGEHAAQTAALRWRAEGRRVSVYISPKVGEDAADLLAAAATRARHAA
jgi:CHC2 zinc finger/Toprim domain